VSGASERFDLRRKTVALIARDRERVGRDARHLRDWEQLVEDAYKAMSKLMREGLERLTKMGI
jgi:hypothetical protein